MKFACIDTKGCFYYPFAQHPRFKFWAYDRLRRHRGIDQCNVFFKQNPEDASLTMDQLRDMIKKNSLEGVQLLNRMSYYAANISGSTSYWSKRRMELQSIIEQCSAPTVFWTVSFADHHWADLHKLMPSRFNCNKFFTHY